jgi:hypothetical protein
MNLIKLPLILVLLGIPLQSGTHLTGGAELDSDSAIHQMDQNSNAHGIQPAVDSDIAPMSIQSQSSRLFEGIGKLKIELLLDGFGIKPLWGQMNASFSIVYQFEIGEDGHPMHIQLLVGEKYIDPKAAEACLRKWVLSGLQTWKKYLLVLNWEHSSGYVSMTILSEQISLTMSLQEECPVP